MFGEVDKRDAVPDAQDSLPRPRRYSYGPDDSQFGDLYLPDGDRRAGTVVLIHGGFWRARLSLAIMEGVAADLAARGWVVWSIEYRRVGNGGGFPETLLDVAAAIDHLAVIDTSDLAEPFSFDLSRVVAVGHSAGGHLATWAAGRHTEGRDPAGRQGWGEDLDAEVPGRHPVVEVTGVVSLAGVLDLEAAAREAIGNGAAVAFMDGDAERRPARYAAADPIKQIPIKAPVRCVHGRADFNVPFEQSLAYVEVAKSVGQDAELLEIEGDHFTVVDVHSSAWPVVLAALDELG
jgi:acetyl esterase/lipase